MAEKQRINYNSIKVVLAQQGVKNKDLAAALNVQPQQVSKWATNTNQPTLRFLFKIAGFLDVHVHTLITPNDRENERPDLPVPLPRQKNKDQSD